MFLKINSVFALDGVLVAVADSKAQDMTLVTPDKMRADDDSMQSWTLQLPKFDPQVSRLHLAISSKDVLYYGDVQTKFTEYETVFKEDFRRE